MLRITYFFALFLVISLAYPKSLHADTSTPPTPVVHADLSAGFAYALNGFIVPSSLRGGLEDGKGGWFHVGLHPTKLEWIEFNCGADYLNKDDGNHGWGIHCGTVFFLSLGNWAKLGLGPFLGYHGERRLLTLSLQKLDAPETLHAFNFGVSPVVEIRLGTEWLWAVGEVEASLSPPGTHAYWEWELAPKIGLKISFE